MDRTMALEVLRAIDRYLISGAGDVKPLTPPLTGLRLRVGDWRVLFEPSGDSGILISKVAHRSVAYRKN